MPQSMSQNVAETAAALLDAASAPFFAEPLALDRWTIAETLDGARPADESFFAACAVVARTVATAMQSGVR